MEETLMGKVHNDKLPPEQKLMLARTRLLARSPFYGHLSMLIDWVKGQPDDPGIKTMGVRIKADKRIECVWWPDFVASQTLHQLIGAVMHELEHVVHLHMARRGARDPIAWNVACDMNVNGTEASPQIGYDDGSGKKVLPLDGKIIFRPKDWDESSSEALYEKVKVRKSKEPCSSCGGSGKKGDSNSGAQSQSKKGTKGESEAGGDPCSGQGDPGDPNPGESSGGSQDSKGSKDGQPCPSCGGNGEMQPFDDHGMWDSPVSAEEARQIVEEMVRDAVEKSRGNVPGHLVDAIEALKKPIVPWNHILRRYLGRSVRGCRDTWSRVRRRRAEFGVKGTSRHAVGRAVVVIDTSGSIGPGELKQFWGEIEAMMCRVSVSVLQWDHAFQGWWPKYRKGDWKKIKIGGRGGTDMVAPIDWLISEGKVPARGPVIMLTDGFCDYHDPCSFPYICVVTTKGGKEPSWGEVVRIGGYGESS